MFTVLVALKDPSQIWNSSAVGASQTDKKAKLPQRVYMGHDAACKFDKEK